jgi:AraC-like DNA-binding protein
MSRRPCIFEDRGRLVIYWDHDLPAVYPEETHETIRICVPLGRALYSVTHHSEAGRALVHHLCARDILVVPTGQSHCVTWRRAADVVSFHMSESFIAHALAVPRVSIVGAFTLRDPFISAATAQLCVALGAEGPSLAFVEAIATAVAYRVGLGAAGGEGIRAKESVPAFSAAQLARVESFIDEHLDQPISLTALAERMDLSVWHFMRRFNVTHGLSPHAFITQRRLERAQRLLADSKLSVTEIALEIGMSLNHFSRSFLKQFGVSPREFRRQRQSSTDGHATASCA